MARIVAPSETNVEDAARTLRHGGLVAFPTETVYGLGAAARDPQALARLYAAKGRPSDHPVIVHLASASALAGWAREVPAAAERLAAAFWPGPLTLVLRRAEHVPDAVTGGQDTVGLRVPDHPLALALLRAFDDGVAAPSANRFGRISPTTAAHVAQEFEGIELTVLDGGPCRVGVESTIVDLSSGAPRLLRPGGVALARLEEVLGERVELAGHLRSDAEATVRRHAAETPRAPGGLARHYAPAAPTERIAPEALPGRLGGGGAGLGVLARRPAPAGFEGVWIAMPEGPTDYARALYAALRRLDASGCRAIVLEEVPDTAAWLAVRDRLRRASARPESSERGLVGSAGQEGT